MFVPVTLIGQINTPLNHEGADHSHDILSLGIMILIYNEPATDHFKLV